MYGILTTIFFAIMLPFFYTERLLSKKSFGWKEKFGKVEPSELGEKIIMLHGVSVGEVIALENLVKKIHKTFKEYKIVITTGTKTGQDIAQKKYDGIADYITYFPFDIPICINNFFEKLKPSVILIAETEIWPNFAQKCGNMGIPLYTINGRISDSTFKSYKLIKPFFEWVLGNYAGIFTQSEDDKNKFIEIGAPAEKVEVMKNLKFDVKKSSEIIDLNSGSSRVIVAGSTHKGEDEIFIDTFMALRFLYSDIKLLLAPRHLARVENAMALVNQVGLTCGLRSQGADFSDNQVVILDTMGELSKTYAKCHFAFIGGSFNRTGGHNPLEATVYGKPVVSGPSIHNFKDIYWLLTRSNAGMIVKNKIELREYMELLLGDEEFYKKACTDCETVFNDQQGALDFVIKKLWDLYT